MLDAILDLTAFRYSDFGRFLLGLCYSPPETVPETVKKPFLAIFGGFDAISSYIYPTIVCPPNKKVENFWSIVVTRRLFDLGAGSSLHFAQEMTAALHVIIGQLKQYLGVDRVRLLDVPCGDLEWMSRFLQTRTDVDYTGVDIVSSVIAHHRSKYSDHPWKFLNVDIVSESIDVADFDLIMTRMMMQHLSHGDVIRILHKFSNVTGPRQRPAFLLATTFAHTAANVKVNVADSRRFASLNLEIEPFRLETPLCLFRDGPPKWLHFMGLWRLPLKVIAESSCRTPVPVSTPLLRGSHVFSCTDWSLPASGR